MKKRIRQLRKELGLNQTEFGERIGIKQGSIAGYESGARTPIDSVVLSMCREFNVNEKWLRTGEGEIFKKRSPQDEVGYFVEELLDYEENPLYDIIIDMMKTYHELDEKSQIVIKAYFGKLRDRIENKKKED